jgi:hypothetical protein
MLQWHLAAAPAARSCQLDERGWRFLVGLGVKVTASWRIRLVSQPLLPFGGHNPWAAGKKGFHTSRLPAITPVSLLQPLLRWRPQHPNEFQLLCFVASSAAADPHCGKSVVKATRGAQSISAEPTPGTLPTHHALRMVTCLPLWHALLLDICCQQFSSHLNPLLCLLAERANWPFDPPQPCAGCEAMQHIKVTVLRFQLWR